LSLVFSLVRDAYGVGRAAVEVARSTFRHIVVTG
jgi:hypothetical protein